MNDEKGRPMTYWGGLASDEKRNRPMTSETESVFDVLQEMVDTSFLIENNYSLSNLQVEEFRDRIEAAHSREVKSALTQPFGPSPFADFFHNATEAERADLFAKVMDAATLAQRMTEHGCRKADICNMDHLRGWGEDKEQRVNRLCTTCYQHWAGPVGAVKEYTRKEWDAEVERGFSDEG